MSVDGVLDQTSSLPARWSRLPLFVAARENRERNLRNRERCVLSLSYGRIVIRDVESNHGLLPASFETYQVVDPGMLVLRLTDLQNDQRSLRVGHVQRRGIITSAYLGLRLTGALHARFAFYVLYSYDVGKVFYRFGGGVRQSMKFADLRRLLLPCPPAGQQRAIADFLDRKTAAIDALIRKKERLLELLAEQHAALIHRAVTRGLDPDVEMKDSGVEWIGEVPAHWEVRRLKRIAARLQGRLIVQPHLYFEEEGVPIVFGYNIKEGRIDEGGLSRVSLDADAAHPHARVRAGDLLTVRLGSPGMTALVQESLDGCHYASIMWVHQHPRADSEWLWHAMNSTIVQAQIGAANYGATLGQFNIADAVNWRLSFPPIEEQRRIARYLTAKLEAISETESKVRTQLDRLREYRQALITAAVTGQLDLSSEGAA